MAREHRGLGPGGAFAYDYCPRALATALRPVHPRSHACAYRRCPTGVDLPGLGACHVYVDGSYIAATADSVAIAGWGCRIGGLGPEPIDCCGPVVVGMSLVPQTCIARLSNNVA